MKTESVLSVARSHFLFTMQNSSKWSSFLVDFQFLNLLHQKWIQAAFATPLSVSSFANTLVMYRVLCRFTSNILR